MNLGSLVSSMFFESPKAPTVDTTMATNEPEAHPKRHDVVVDDDFASKADHVANVLLRDLLQLHVLLRSDSSTSKKSQSDTLDSKTGEHMIQIMKQGCTHVFPAQVDSAPPALVDGSGSFVTKKGSEWVSVDDTLALEYVKKEYSKQLAAYQGQKEPVADITSAPVTGTAVSEAGEDENKSGAGGSCSTNVPGVATGNFMPSVDDVVLVKREDVVEQNPVSRTGTTHLISEIGRFLSRNKLWVKTQGSRRAEAALSIASTMAGSKVRLLEQSGTADKIQLKEIDNAHAVEFMLFLLFDSILNREDEISKGHPLLDLDNYPAEEFAKPSTSPIDEPTVHDVLFGRGGMTNQHPGNRRYRDVISLHREDYKHAIKVEKPNVSRRIVRAIRCGSPPGRFLRKDPDGLWYDVGDKTAAEKTSQALRERTADEKALSKVEGGDKKRPASGLAGTPPPAKLRVATGRVKPLSPLTPAEIHHMATRHLPPIAPPKIPPIDEYNAATQMVSKLESGLKAKKNGKTDLAVGFTGNVETLDKDGNILVTDNDILCGRGGMTNHHIGNRRFRDIIALHKPDYQKVPKIHKPAVAKLIVKAIRGSDPPGRFLRKDEKTGKWCDIGDQKAAEKASQALREKTNEERDRAKVEQSGPTLSMYTNPELYRATSEALRSILPREDGDGSAANDATKTATI